MPNISYREIFTHQGHIQGGDGKNGEGEEKIDKKAITGENVTYFSNVWHGGTTKSIIIYCTL